MIVEERCCCGAEIAVKPESYNLSRAEQSDEQHRAVKTLESWRRLHKGCRDLAQKVPVSAPAVVAMRAPCPIAYQPDGQPNTLLACRKPNGHAGPHGPKEVTPDA